MGKKRIRDVVKGREPWSQRGEGGKKGRKVREREEHKRNHTRKKYFPNVNDGENKGG